MKRKVLVDEIVTRGHTYEVDPKIGDRIVYANEEAPWETIEWTCTKTTTRPGMYKAVHYVTREDLDG